MLEQIFGIAGTETLGQLGALAATVGIVVEVLKQIIPKTFPTKLLAILVSLVVSIGFVLLAYGGDVKMIIMGVLMGFVVSYVSMFGFDTLKDLYKRFSLKGDK